MVLAIGTVVVLATIGLTVAAVVSPGARSHAAHRHESRHEDHAVRNESRHEGHAVTTLDPTAEAAALSAQLSVTARFVDAFPTIAAAEAAGYTRSGAFAPGLGTHYDLLDRTNWNVDGRMSFADLLHPTLIYDGLDPSAPLAGFMYVAVSPDEPSGFAGPNDHWHAHTNICVVTRDGSRAAPIGADGDATEEQCGAIGGVFYAKTAYMVHVWTVPGYESELGVFSEQNPAITCPDGSSDMKDVDSIGFSQSACRTS